MLPITVLVACQNQDRDLPNIQAVPDNKAMINPADFESVAIRGGLTSKTLLVGDGPVIESGATAIVHYTGWLFDSEAIYNRGIQFDSSVDRGAPFRFPIGEGRVISGWDYGVAGMRVGEVRELTIAPEMAYGQRGAGGIIPPEATLIFVVELLGIEGQADGA